ncbi:hypothetical protein GCV60_14205 [Listeria monocytogenes]|nr:hypothetical protein [Listeria monocytogenes]EDH3594486.1 hypothetical protein [Listeria monocytogenes]RJZ12905.1 hypothetical protein DYZ47_02692 [Listeria monocytogenes]TYV61093.1 hypothetical protein FZ042_13275 [Listeria monocytogenes]
MKGKEERREKKKVKQLKKVQRKETIRRLPTHKKIFRYVGLTMFCVAVIIFLLTTLGTVAQATGLVDDTINIANEYSKYGLSNYQLDFYVDNNWDWLPWNWSDGLGKSVMYGLYAITNFVWTISLYLSYATGYLVQEAYSLDFISHTADAIGKNIQTIAGVTRSGFSNSGFYVGFLLILIFVLGIYVTYTGMIKRETTKAVQAVLNFVVVFILSASFIAYAPDYISKINGFSKDVSNASLDVGTRIVMPNTNSKGKDSIDMIRDSLFSVQVKQPWLLLQFGSTNIENLGADRTEKLLSTSPDTNNGKDREAIVMDEIEKEGNKNLTLTNTISRLGMVFFLFLFNIGISIFVFLLTGIMIFSQVLFIVFAMFLPVSFLLSMIPTFEGMGKKAITRLFNVIMTRAGITLIITVAFSISTMLYSLSASSPFFMIMFLQIVTFAGIYFKLGDLMSMFALQSSDSQSMGRQLFRRPRMFMNRHTRRFQRKMSRTLGGSQSSPAKAGKKEVPSKKVRKAAHERNKQTMVNRVSTDLPKDSTVKSHNVGEKAGKKIGMVMDTKNRLVDKAKDIKDQVKDTPTNAKYALHKGKRDLVQNASDFSQSITNTRKQKQEERSNTRNQKRATLAQKRLEMDRAKQNNKTEPSYFTRQYQLERELNRRRTPVSAKVDSKQAGKVAMIPPKSKVEPSEGTTTVIRENQQISRAPIIQKPSVKNHSSENRIVRSKEYTTKTRENQSSRNQTSHKKNITTSKGRKK